MLKQKEKERKAKFNFLYFILTSVLLKNSLLELVEI